VQTQDVQRELEDAQQRSEQVSVRMLFSSHCRTPVSHLDCVLALWQLKAEVRRLSREYDAKFNEPWGQLFKAGLHDSRFGKQVHCFARYHVADCCD
jgi:hypothetical protein